MKKFIFVVLSMIFILSIGACAVTGQNTSPAESDNTATSLEEQSQPVLTPTPTPDPAISDVPKATDAVSLCEQLMQEKGWSKYPYADIVQKAVYIILTSTDEYTPAELAEKFRRNVEAVNISDEIEYGYFDVITRTVELNTEFGDVVSVVHELGHGISGYTDNFLKTMGMIDQPKWCFRSQDWEYTATAKSSGRLVEGLTDFLISRNLEDVSIRKGGNILNGTFVELLRYDPNGPYYPNEQGFAILFYYAVGSSLVERTFFGDNEASDQFISMFAEKYGSETLENLIRAIDKIIPYMDAPNRYTKEEQAQGLAEIKAYIADLLDLMEIRMEKISSQEEIDEFLSDLEGFKSVFSINNKTFMQQVNDRIEDMKAGSKNKPVN